MKQLIVFSSVLGFSALGGICKAESNSTWEQETLTNGFWGLNDRLADLGIEVGLGITNVYQQNVRGGISTHRRAGRITGSYDLELSADLQKLLGFESGSLFLHLEGGWPDTKGIDEPSVGSAFGINADAFWDRAMLVSELWYEQPMFDGALLFRVGKMDLFTGGFECGGYPRAFDRSAFANDETSQFLNGALVNNPTIPFPAYALGVASFYNPTDAWYVSAAILDAQSDAREMGFSTTFNGDDYFFYIFEIGITPQFNSTNGLLQGAYRVGFWADPQPKAHSDTSNTYRNDAGFYLSFDQLLAKENSEPEDNQGLGAFFRYGYADGKRNDLTNFWSLGFQYQGLLEGRDDDVLGVGFAHGSFSNLASSTYTDDHENALEFYYNTQVRPWLSLSPSIQYIGNPGGDKTVSDAVVLGLRAQLTF